MISIKERELIKQALIEDINYIDITTDNLIDESNISSCKLIAKENGVISGLDVLIETFHLLDKGIEITCFCKNGEYVHNQFVIAEIKGNTRNILKGERVALNFLQRMSGIASLTRLFVKEVNGCHTKIVDTRKTTPLIRIFEKKAVRDGGAFNHRFNLSDSVMIKDNHIKAAGGIKEAITSIKEKVGLTTKIEIEVETITQFKEALQYGADIIMLDNMSTSDMKNCVDYNHGKAILEASGNMDLSRIREVCESGVDYISVGALTHSYRSLDISLKF